MATLRTQVNLEAAELTRHLLARAVIALRAWALSSQQAWAEMSCVISENKYKLCGMDVHYLDVFNFG
jgi:hypothetical protein